MESFNGMKVVVSPLALEATQERLFPTSRNRSKRILKKLVKRFGSEFRMVPCIWKTKDTIIMHPVMYAALKARTAPINNAHDVESGGINYLKIVGSIPVPSELERPSP